MSFCALPDVLQDLVTDFAWKIPAKVIHKNVDDVLRIKSFELPPLFFKVYIFDRRICKYITSPLLVYEPFWEMNQHISHSGAPVQSGFS